ncbi:ankyrin-3-like [Saccostrea cucullata]|uniref:ankyrin-3-like n=1 Tax=Saccostrea cuccullata TaxID=36930 RepID=UPI002ED2219B
MAKHGEIVHIKENKKNENTEQGLNSTEKDTGSVPHSSCQSGKTKYPEVKGVPDIETKLENARKLHTACGNAQYEVCQYILSQSLNLIEVLATNGWNTPHCAAKGGDVRILKLLAEKGLPVTETTKNNETILHIACLHAKYEMCQYILSQFPNLLNVVDIYGWNEAHFAARGGDVRILQLMADEGLPVTKTTKTNETILHIACLYAKYEMCQYILSQYPYMLKVVDANERNAAHCAAVGGDIRILQLLANKSFPVTAITKTKYTILHIACLHAKYQLCQYILSQYSNILEVVDTNGWNAAHCAAQGGHVRILQLLVDNGLSVSETTKHNLTVLHIACLSAKYEMCEYILSQYPSLLNIIDKTGRNAAHFAAQGGDIRILQLLTDKGLTGTESIRNNSTVLHIACGDAKYEMCEYILSLYPNLLKEVDGNGWNAAHYAAQGGDVRILKLLKDKCLPVTISATDNINILHIACVHAKYEMCQYILSQYPNMLNDADKNGWNAAHFAAKGGNVNIFKLLEENDLRITGGRRQYGTILHIACQNAKYQMCKYILSQYSFLLNAENTSGWNAAHCAAQGGDVRILQFLIDKGVKISQTSDNYVTILHIACFHAKYEMCQYILSQYPDLLNFVEENGWSAAHCAAMAGDVNILKLLADNGLPVTETREYTANILHMACGYAKYEMCQYILSQYPNMLKDVDGNGWNAAHYAAQGGDVNILQILADKGLSVTETTKNNETILHIACLHAKYEMSQYIMSRYPRILNYVDNTGRHAAHCALQGGDVHILQLLKERRVHVNFK